MYKDFALELHSGMYLSQLTSNNEHSDIHCQLMDDLITLKLDQSNGRIIEFPLTSVSKMYCLIRNNDKWYSAGAPLPESQMLTAEFYVVIEFMRRTLAFVFKNFDTSQRFLMCMDLLMTRAQQEYEVMNPPQMEFQPPTSCIDPSHNPFLPCAGASV